MLNQKSKAMKRMIRILAHYDENYGSPDAPHWKRKGVQEFNALIDLDTLMYMREEVEAAIQEVLSIWRTNTMVRYTLLSAEPMFSKPEALCPEGRLDRAIRRHTRHGYRGGPEIDYGRDNETAMFSAMQEGTDGG
jgi:hypothetical protein